MKYKALKDYLEFVQINGRLFIAIAVALVALVALQFHTTTYKKECLGVVDLKETKIAFDAPVIIKNIFVLPGQRVKKGQALLEVTLGGTTLKILELRTLLDQLISEKDIRNSLFPTNGEKKTLTPTEIQISGLKKQIHEMQKTMSQAIRFAENDGVVGSVHFRVREQVAPFLPIITLNSTEPNLAYGFLHEDRLSDFRLGESILVQSLSVKSKSIAGKVVSLGNRITEFPERLTGSSQVKFWGREIVVSLPDKNAFMPGEKVQLISRNGPPGLHFDFVKAKAASTSSEEAPNVVAYNLPLEAGGLAFIPNTDETQLLVVSDDLNKSNKSPFWKINLNEPSGQNHQSMVLSGKISKKEDIESVSYDGVNYYALGSMNASKKGGHLIVFKIKNEQVVVLNKIRFREKLLQSLVNIPTLNSLKTLMTEKIDIEGFSTQQGKAILAFKNPTFEDDSSILVEIQNFTEFILSSGKTNLQIQMISPLVFHSDQCQGKSLISDLTHTMQGLLILTNCKGRNLSQLWIYNSNRNMSFPHLLDSFDIANLEGLLMGADNSTVYLSDDNGNDGSSTIFRTNIQISR